MRVYIATTGVVFGLITAAHIWRVVAEGTQLAKDPFFILITVLAAGLSVWAITLLRRSSRV
jgi:hypothetical protein